MLNRRYIGRVTLLDEHIKKINRSLVTGWTFIVVILAAAYIMEVIR